MNEPERLTPIVIVGARGRMGTALIREVIASDTLVLGDALMLALSWPEVGDLHPFAPTEQAAGYSALFASLCRSLASITGFHFS